MNSLFMSASRWDFLGKKPFMISDIQNGLKYFKALRLLKLQFCLININLCINKTSPFSPFRNGQYI